MRKIALVLTAILSMTSIAHADWNGHRHYQPRHHYHNGGGDNGAALFGGLVGGLIIGGMINQMSQPRYQTYYEPFCREVIVNRYWNGWQWVYRTATVCE